ncbi:hypothetical protein Tco_0254349, partial [Tanacetum coccineum]
FLEKVKKILPGLVLLTPDAKEDPSYATINGEHIDVVGNPCENEGPIAKEPISNALNTLVDKRDVLMTDAHDTINHADPPSHEFEITSPYGSKKKRRRIRWSKS